MSPDHPRTSASTTSVTHTLEQLRVVPVVVIDDAARAHDLAGALVAGGLPIAEVTLRTAAALDAIRTMAARGDVVVGAGTVLTADHVDLAADAGAQFVVSPGLSRAVVDRARHHGVGVIPGAVTATEVQTAQAMGLDIVKFFPANTSGGPAAIAALAAPFAAMRFVPTGGVTATNVGDYLSLGSVVAVGGSWMVPRTAIEFGRWDQITDLTAQAVAATNAVTKGAS